MPVFNRVIDRVAADEAYLEETLAAASRCLVFVFVCKSVRGIHACTPPLPLLRGGLPEGDAGSCFIRVQASIFCLRVCWEAHTCVPHSP